MKTSVLMLRKHDSMWCHWKWLLLFVAFGVTTMDSFLNTPHRIHFTNYCHIFYTHGLNHSCKHTHTHAKYISVCVCVCVCVYRLCKIKLKEKNIKNECCSFYPLFFKYRHHPKRQIIYCLAEITWFDNIPCCYEREELQLSTPVFLHHVLNVQ